VRQQKATGEYYSWVHSPLLTVSQVKVDEKNKTFLDAYQAQKMKTDVRFQLWDSERSLTSV
jgi:hypothetical protein